MRLILAMCIAEVLTMAGVFAFPALLPTFVGEWGLSKTQAGWIAGIYFGAYALTAPPVLALTDRLDARWVYLSGAVTAAAAAAGFASLADGFWTALLFRALGGAALAATYLPGLRVLMDRHRGPRPTRALSFYTASFSLGTALSFLLAGEIAALFGWRASFAATAGAALCAATVPLRLWPFPSLGKPTSIYSTSGRCWPTVAPSPTCWATASTAGSCSRRVLGSSPFSPLERDSLRPKRIRRW